MEKRVPVCIFDKSVKTKQKNKKEPERREEKRKDIPGIEKYSVSKCECNRAIAYNPIHGRMTPDARCLMPNF